jgi:uncharacterized membrane protein/predicted DsbA family dithiol-disulfide isomerase
VPALAGLVASSMLAIDYLRRAPVFCAEGGGCDALRHTAVAVPLGIPLPLFGLGGFLALGIVSLLGGARARFVQLALAGGGALVGGALLFAQALLGHFCPFCCVADASAIAAAVVAGVRLSRSPSPPLPAWALATGGAALAAAAGVPLVVGARASPLPRAIRDEMARTPRGMTTVVDFVDFECPFCRMTHATLEPLLHEHEGRVRVVRRQVPLSIHPHARAAARAACCGELLGRGEPMAAALFTAPVSELTREGCEHIAQTLGLDLAPYRACVDDPGTDARIDADRAEFHAAGGFALPTIWIGGEQLVGAQPREALERALQGAVARAGS